MRIAPRNAPTERQIVRIRVIDAWDSLGYRGIGREEHSGENTPAEPPDLYAELADNKSGQIHPRAHRSRR